MCMQTKPGAQMGLGNCSMTSKGGLPGPQEGCLTPACTSAAEFHLLSRPAAVSVSWAASFAQTSVIRFSGHGGIWSDVGLDDLGCLFHP